MVQAERARPLRHNLRGADGGVLSVGQFCVAVGTDGSGVLIERWTGSGWSKHHPPVRPVGHALRRLLPVGVECYAVGSNLTASGGSLVERWNGKTWSQSTTPVPRNASYPGLQAVWCVSATICGWRWREPRRVRGLVERQRLAPGQHDHHWRRHRLLLRGGLLASVSCAALAGTTRCRRHAVGSAYWNGSRWKVVLTA